MGLKLKSSGRMGSCFNISSPEALSLLKQLQAFRVSLKMDGSLRPLLHKTAHKHFRVGQRVWLGDKTDWLPLLEDLS